MIFVNKNIKENSAGFFIGAFLSFLFLSFFHTHHFDIAVVHENEFITSDENVIGDNLLDSSFKCIIHAFHNSIQNDGVYSLSDLSIRNISCKLYHLYSSHYSHLIFSSKKLRAPPSDLV